MADPLPFLEFVIGFYFVGIDIGDENEIHVDSLAAGRVFFVANESERGSIDFARFRKTPHQTRFFAKFSGGSFERRFTLVNFAAGRKPNTESAMMNEEDATLVTRINSH